MKLIFKSVNLIIKYLNANILFRGFILPNGKYIGKNIFEELINLNSGHDYKLAHKVTSRHLLVEGTGRMNVKLAAQLLSNTVAKAITFCGNRGDLNTYNWRDVSIMIF